ncbi:DegT/DnrJ/EryC1/StrS family aminotransferase [Candidatus Pelagibacter sp.]|uniref:DegT/DnrJ/EryC1/StrS family aminotransferase n=1 Tax=Candidatus Pelagibacter sp. TaxID=2024849 RepID=UPI003D0962A1
MTKVKVPFNYLQFQFKNNAEIFKDWKKLIKTTDFTLGHKVLEFENKFSKYIGAKYCISTNNGTDALILSLKALGIKKGDEVITVCNSFYATTGAIVACGAIPVFVDCDDRYQIDINLIEEKINTKTKAILPVHWGGASPDMYKIKKLAKKFKLKILEDACMGIGAKIKNKSPGTFGDIGAYSMHPLKSLNVMGDGGMIVTNNKKLADWIKCYRNHGMINRDNNKIWGVNARLQPLQAVVAINQLKNLDRIIKIRNKNAKILDEGLKKLKKYIIVPERVKNFTETFALYMCLFKKRDKLKFFLEKNGVEVKIHYPKPLHLQEASRIYGYKKNSFLKAEKQCKYLLTLPVHQYLSKKQLMLMVKLIKQFYNENK